MIGRRQHLPYAVARTVLHLQLEAAVVIDPRHGGRRDGDDKSLVDRLGVTLFGLFLTPVFYVVLRRMVLPRDARKAVATPAE